VAIEWYQANGPTTPHPWNARDSRKALHIWPPATVTMHFTPPIDRPARARHPLRTFCGYRVVPGEWAYDPASMDRSR
jgi:hypothetical protein